MDTPMRLVLDHIYHLLNTYPSIPLPHREPYLPHTYIIANNISALVHYEIDSRLHCTVEPHNIRIELNRLEGTGYGSGYSNANPGYSIENPRYRMRVLYGDRTIVDTLREGLEISRREYAVGVLETAVEMGIARLRDVDEERLLCQRQRPSIERGIRRPLEVDLLPRRGDRHPGMRMSSFEDRPTFDDLLRMDPPPRNIMAGSRSGTTSTDRGLYSHRRRSSGKSDLERHLFDRSSIERRNLNLGRLHAERRRPESFIGSGYEYAAHLRRNPGTAEPLGDSARRLRDALNDRVSQPRPSMRNQADRPSWFFDRPTHDRGPIGQNGLRGLGPRRVSEFNRVPQPLSVSRSGGPSPGRFNGLMNGRQDLRQSLEDRSLRHYGVWTRTSEPRSSVAQLGRVPGLRSYTLSSDGASPSNDSMSESLSHCSSEKSLTTDEESNSGLSEDSDSSDDEMSSCGSFTSSGYCGECDREWSCKGCGDESNASDSSDSGISATHMSNTEPVNRSDVDNSDEVLSEALRRVLGIQTPPSTSDEDIPPLASPAGSASDDPYGGLPALVDDSDGLEHPNEAAGTDSSAEATNPFDDPKYELLHDEQPVDQDDQGSNASRSESSEESDDRWDLSAVVR